MNTTLRIGGLILRITLAVIAVSSALFSLGFLFGYVLWLPQLQRSRVMQAVDTGLVFICIAAVIDPVLMSQSIWRLSKFLRIFGSRIGGLTGKNQPD